MSSLDLIQMKKIHAMGRYKRSRFLDQLYFYFLTVLTCSVFYLITSSLPYLSSIVKVVFFVLIPGFASVSLSSKMLFIIGNLIILATVVDSRIFSPHYSSSTTHVCFYDEYINSSQTQWPQIPDSQFKRSKEKEKSVAEKVKRMNREESEQQSVVSACDELNKRADEFIARVLRQRRLELSHLKRDSFSMGYN